MQVGCRAMRQANIAKRQRRFKLCRTVDFQLVKMHLAGQLDPFGVSFTGPRYPGWRCAYLGRIAEISPGSIDYSFSPETTISCSVAGSYS